MSLWLSDLFLSSQSDERLVALARVGQDRAFAAIVQRYRAPLKAFARRLDANGTADDLVQQTFLSAFAALRAGAEVRHLRGWLHQILRNTVVRAAKGSEQPAGLEHLEAGTQSAQHMAELRISTEEAFEAIARLPSRQHQALVATAIQGRSRAEVAETLGLSEGAVRQLVHRARETLRTAVTAITPYSIARALAARSVAGPIPDAAVGAGLGAGGAVTLKVGALVASGVLAAGILSSVPHHESGRTRAGRSHAIAAKIRGGSPSASRVQASAGLLLPGAAVPLGISGHGSRHGRDGNSGPGSGGRVAGRSDGGPSGTLASTSSSDGGSSGPSSGSSGGGSMTSGSSDGASGSGSTTTSGSDGGSGGGGPGPSGTTSATSTTSSGSDGGTSTTSGASGSGDTLTTSGGH